VSYTADFFLPGKRIFGHTWSLAVEEQFYLLWPAALLLLGKRRALCLAGLLLVICPVMRVLSFVLMAHHASITALIQDPRFRFDTQADALVMGCLLCGLRVTLHRRRWYRNLLASRAFVLVPALGLVVGELGEQHLQMVALPYLVGGYAATNLAIALSLDWCLTHPSGTAGRLLNARPVAAIGVMSYSIYLWQEPFLYISRSGWWHAAPMNLGLTLVAAAASYLLIERPCLRLRKRWEQHMFPGTSVARGSVPDSTGHSRRGLEKQSSRQGKSVGDRAPSYFPVATAHSRIAGHARALWGASVTRTWRVPLYNVNQ
jgi:peptidoglycan/LPS O-acetylase OafA/YrhL